MTQSRSLSEKFPSYRQEACTTENIIQCLSIRERKKGLGVEGRINENKEKKQIKEEHKEPRKTITKRGKNLTV